MGLPRGDELLPFAYVKPKLLDRAGGLRISLTIKTARFGVLFDR